MSTGAPRGFWPMRDLPVVIWLTCAVVVSLAHPFLPTPRWLLIHLVLLGALTHSILVWSRYFSDALLHTPSDPGDRGRQNRRLVLLNTGVLAVLVGVLGTWWIPTTLGAAAVVVAVLWHGTTLLRHLRAALPARFGTTVRYYLAAAALLPVGVTIGVVLARVQEDPWHARLRLAHAAINLFGWIGLTALGTLVTLWPTMLRTRIAPGAEKAADRALPVLLGGVVAAAAGALVDLRWLTVLGFLICLVGVTVVAPPFVRAARGRPPTAFCTLSVLAAATWLVGLLATLVVVLAPAATWEEMGVRLAWLTPFLAAGFGLQLLLGALSYLVPVALGGGPGPVRAATQVLDRGAPTRVAATNLGLLLSALPVPPPVRVLSSTLVLVTLASFLPLLVLALRASSRVKRGSPAPQVSTPDHSRLRRQAAVGVVVALVAAGCGVVVDRVGLSVFRADPVSASVAATGHTTVVRVRARDMRFYPSRIAVPMGDRLVIEVKNTDDQDVHDLVLDDGQETDRISPGDTERLDVGVVGRDADGWCSVVGHRRMGMTLSVETVGAPAAGSDSTPGSTPTSPEHASEPASGQSTEPDLSVAPDPSFESRDAALPALPRARVHRRTFHVRETVREVAPGVTQKLWTYNGTAPGPVLHGRVGDRFVITLINDATSGHSVDFHAGALAPTRPMRTIPPGERLSYRFTATRAGIWMYHCSSMPMSAHIANGLFGAVVIDPPDLPPVDRSYVLVQSELYLGAQGAEVDVEKLAGERPDLVVFNGYANQYDHRPLRARAGERVRVWVLDAGPNRASSFHIIGAQFDSTYLEGAWRLRGTTGGAQALGLFPAQGGFVDLTFPEPGRYPFVSHLMVDAERGAHGLFSVRR